MVQAAQPQRQLSPYEVYQQRVQQYVAQIKQAQGQDPNSPTSQEDQAAAEDAASGGGGGVGQTIGGALTLAGSTYAKMKLQQYMKSKAEAKNAPKTNTTTDAPAVTGPSSSFLSGTSAKTQADWNAGADAATNAEIGGQSTMQSTMQSGVKAPLQTDVDPKSVSPDTQVKVTDPNTGKSWMDSAGRVAQGAIGAYQVYQGYQTFKDGDKVGGSMSMAAGGTNVAAALGSSTASKAVPYVNAAMAAYNIGKTLTNGDMTSEQQATRAQQQAALAVADFYTFGGASLAEGLLRSNKKTAKYLEKLDRLDQKTNPITMAMAHFGSSKDADQMARDKVRKFLAERGVINDGGNKDWKINFSDKSSFDLGKDGGARLDDGRRYWETDAKNPYTANVTGLANILAGLDVGAKKGDEKLFVSTAGGLTNAFMNGTNDPRVMRQRALEAFMKHGFKDKASTVAAIDSALKQKVISDDLANKFKFGTNQLFDSDSVAPQAGATVVPVPVPVSSNSRSKTSSPGIGKDGKRISYSGSKR